MFSLIFNNEKCTGCKACEIACSYHHAKVFNPKLASLYIHHIEREGRISIIQRKDLPEKERGRRFACDLCADEPKPLCVKYCAPSAITVAELESS